MCTGLLAVTAHATQVIRGGDNYLFQYSVTLLEIKGQGHLWILAYVIVLARSVGIPGRFAIGATIPPDRNEGAIGGYHGWAELWANGQWIPMDIREASKNPSLKDYYFGQHPANRIEFCVGRDHKLRPAPESGPPNYLIYPLLEIEGEPTDAKIAFSFKRSGTGK